MMEMAMKILNMGSMNIDYVYSVNHIVASGETESAFKRQVFLGGKGINQSVALARAGLDVFHAGLIGNDGSCFLDECRRNNVNADYIRIVNENTGHTVIQVSDNGQNCIILYGGANRCLTRDYVDHVLSGFSEDDIIILQNEINLVDYIVERSFEKGMKIVLNPSPFNELINKIDLDKIYLFFINEVEGYQLAGETDPNLIISKMITMFPKGRIVLTVGKNGAYYADRAVTVFEPAADVQPLDTTAAGDTFSGYFIAGIIGGYTIERAMKLASTASGIAITRKGALPSIPFRSEVESKMR